MHQFWPSVTREWLGGMRGGAGRGGEWGVGREVAKALRLKHGTTSRPQMVLTIQLDEGHHSSRG